MCWKYMKILDLIYIVNFLQYIIMYGFIDFVFNLFAQCTCTVQWEWVILDFGTKNVEKYEDALCEWTNFEELTEDSRQMIKVWIEFFILLYIIKFIGRTDFQLGINIFWFLKRKVIVSQMAILMHSTVESSSVSWIRQNTEWR